MAVTTLSSREFNQDTGRAKKAAQDGPVIITDRGDPSHVLLTFEAYQQLVETPATLIDRLGRPKGVENVDLERELEVARSSETARAAEFP